MRFTSKLTTINLLSLAVFGAGLTLIGAGFSAEAERGNWQDRLSEQPAVSTRSGHTIPAGQWGIIEIRNARQGNMLHLNGVVGTGKIVLRTARDGLCDMATIEMVAGNFNGHSFGIRSIGPIRMAIESPSLARSLRRGNDIASDELVVSDANFGQLGGGDIRLLEGLDSSYGFVLEPGNSLFDSWFGARYRTVDCLPSRRDG